MGTIDWNEKLILNQRSPYRRHHRATLHCSTLGELQTARLSGGGGDPGLSGTPPGGMGWREKERDLSEPAQRPQLRC